MIAVIFEVWPKPDRKQAWRATNEHRVAQAKGRKEIFSNYRLRVAGVIGDYGMQEREQVPGDSREVHRG